MKSRRVLLLGIFVLLSLILSPLFSVNAQSGTSDESPIKIWVNWDVPTDFRDMLAPLWDLDHYEEVIDREQAQLELTYTGSGGAITSQWLYVPVVPFASFAESISFSDIQRYWNGNDAALSNLTPDNSPSQLIVTNSVLKAMTLFLGEPDPTISIQVVPADALTTQLWEQRPNAWSMVAFNQLTPDLKVLALDGVDVFRDDFSIEDYPFKVEIGLTGEVQSVVGQAVEDLLVAGTWRGTNRDSSRLTRVILSGVTALTRATGYAMETRGMTLPGEAILPFVQDADIFHTSNEVPFSVQCPYPDPYLGNTIFCANDDYLELLEYIGLDVVELTGNHVNDYGPGALHHTLELYDEAGMAYFGGGNTPEEARAAWITEHNGNTIAFIGCNLPGPFKAWVSDERPGAAPCDEVFLEEELPRLAGEVDIVIMTVQHYEYYRYQVPNAQLDMFNNFANLGADVVIGSQAHQPQGFTFTPRFGENVAFLHHGLGNLFFDQMAEIATRQSFMDKLMIYDGRLISVQLFTGLIEEYCCPRPMTQTERNDFLGIIFEASGW